MKFLMVFDFDHTVVDENSDLWVVRCLPSGRLPSSIEGSYRGGLWLEYMCRVMKYIGDQGVGPDDVRGVMESIPFTDGMPDLLTFILENKSAVDCIVISDSNSLFINWVLQAAGLHAAVDKVFTNPAEFDGAGRMVVRPHHAHDCSKCPPNICKRTVLERYLAERAEDGARYERVFYVGDGGNDLCPAFCLRAQDAVMPRRNFTLLKLLARLEAQPGAGPVKADVLPWSSGADILQELRASMVPKK
ncbi:pyridoxal phosphate phosphatase PHOSPHO2 [Oryzias melastigma]|uniref:Phosphatase, orphan 2 n=1 Tax=Oryzias melastigma TaxID=30732 RepID=A0A3B3CLA1_ORYME|nr:pyridoxal phosphate phosphatase PHOSPHO2 [Oryzias melastigma]XP_024151985.1 pyridoxal phosphate phosphatase PHOSPHO2 [Oryzias melastigma]